MSWYINVDSTGNKIHRADCGFARVWDVVPKWQPYGSLAQAEEAAKRHRPAISTAARARAGCPGKLPASAYR